MSSQYEVQYFVKKKVDHSWKIGNPSIRYNNITFVLSGETEYVSGEHTFQLTGGEAIFLPVGSKQYAQTKGMECVAFSYNSDTLLFPCVTKFTWNNDSMLNAYFEDFKQAWGIQSDIVKMRCEGLFLLIMSRLLELQQLKQTNPYITQIKNYLHKNYAEQITVQKIAEEVNLNSVYCGALFTKETGITILQYTNSLRVTKAKELLQCTESPISEIAVEVGINDLYYFSRVFKKIVGISPREYRIRQYKQNDST